MTFLDKKPEPEAEFAEEIKQAEAELAASPEPIPAPEAETEKTEEASDIVEQAKAEPEVAKPEPAKAESEEKDGKVPISALHQARREKQEMERQVQEWANYVRQVQEWAQQHYQGQQQAPPGEEPIDVNADPLAALDRIKSANERLQQEMQEFRAQQAMQQESQAVLHAYRSAAAQFAAETKDFQDAYKYALNSRAAELQALGMPPHVAAQQIAQEEQHLAVTALRNRQNPAQVIYQFAKARGYQGPKPANIKPPADKVVELQADKAEAATTISTGGKQAAPDITDTDGANLKGAAFDSWWEKKFKSERRQSGLFRV